MPCRHVACGVSEHEPRRGRRQAAASGVEGRAGYFPTLIEVPETDRPVVPRGDRVAAVRREVDGAEGAGVPGEDLQVVRRPDVPRPKRSRPRTDDGAAAVKSQSDSDPSSGRS
jgi:hypothetical protein